MSFISKCYKDKQLYYAAVLIYCKQRLGCNVFIVLFIGSGEEDY